MTLNTYKENEKLEKSNKIIKKKNNSKYPQNYKNINKNNFIKYEQNLNNSKKEDNIISNEKQINLEEGK